MPFMDCGAGVALCGVLVLQTGYGPDKYHHDTPGVHGLWPETGDYGTSSCIAVGDDSPIEQTSYCYQEEGDVGFQQHEWGKHGVCSGTKNSDDFFSQLCTLAVEPLKVMTDARAAGGDLGAINASAVEAGFPVFDVDPVDSQLYFSVCAGDDRQWKLANVADMPTLCPWTGPIPAPAPPAPPTPNPPSPSSDICVPSEHGPRCSEDSDCAGITDCVRCAGSGYCTEVPLWEATLV